jgi:uncharacterized SAM-dependent methyltransferase
MTPLSLPTILLYDAKGLAIYDEITRLEEYYLVEAETDIFRRKSEEIIDTIFAGEGKEHGAAIVELGCG